MNKSHYTIVLLSISALFYSCATDRSIAQRIASFENITADEQPCFVQKNDGTIQYFSTLKLVKSVFGTPHLLADGDIRINSTDIRAYQDRDHYAVSQKVFIAGRFSKVADQALPGFGIRVIKGKLNVYTKKFYNGERPVNEYFLQSGENGDIKLYSPELMNELVRSDEAAFNFFNKKTEKATETERLLAAAVLFNTGQLVSKN